MSEKEEHMAEIIPLKGKITDEEFQMFVDALLGTYNGGGIQSE